MWKTEYSATTDLPVRAVWEALRDIHTGAVPNGGVTSSRFTARTRWVRNCR